MENVKKSNCKKILIIAQTTYELKRFDNIVQKIKSYNYDIVIENTICAATRMRQEETDKISKEVEYMIIVGGPKSSNTQKLYEISKSNCKNVILVETIDDIDIEVHLYSQLYAVCVCVCVCVCKSTAYHRMVLCD